MTTAHPYSENTGPAPAGAGAADLLARLANVPADRPAVVAGDRELTFGELRAEAGRVARRLAGRGVGPESVVALGLPRGADLVVALIGTLTAGAAYLPVDPALPAERRRYLVEDSAADLLIVADDAADRIADAGAEASDGPGRVAVGELTSSADPLAEGGFAPVPVDAQGLAYVIYTSGSTGLPKGVEVSRGSASALLAELESEAIAAPGPGRVGWNASPSFDASVQQWVRLCRGDTLVMIDTETRSDPALLAALIGDRSLTDLDITPSHAEPLLEHLPSRDAAADGPLTLLIGGEAISPALWARLAELVDEGVVRAVNLYGPTECTVDATAGWIAAGDDPHIGAVLPGLRMRLLDDGLRPVADGETGELYLAGPRVARGYRGRPGLTAERFVADLSAGGSRMYRTGDLCRRLPDGRLTYLGRADGQVKVRGHRVELYEIEAAVTGHPAVAEAAVVLRDDVNGSAGLVAYYRTSHPVTEAALREHLTATLPGYMVPAVLMEVARFATTPSGKLDRAVLPAPVGAAPVADTAAAAGGPAADEPAGPVEELIARVWAQVLDRPRIGADDNFFKLGGHSLLAIKLVAGVRRELGVSLPVKTVYAHPRLRDLAGRIESMLAAREAERQPAGVSA
ncbi:non-ribosomal peptide synthetase [Streptomyces sp. IB2014 016-6]|uniref:non-ribosomal peptide synthetase n=1 Tax=Streptomyces sp. IB2014 016-6 TaxID=2517818 RepID=UPI0011CB9985|nr:non-ribosomal peptide synthetase [Streptomyces sp. IB2014 016-6]TXL89742.1 amino acid adenylation domain-containing protein [Streptomyces sp. IB2014 016-6]